MTAAWIEQWHHDIVDVSRLPLPEQIEHPACMTGRLLPGAARRVRQLAPRPALRDCCDTTARTGPWGRHFSGQR
jgi:hypothetical protein